LPQKQPWQYKVIEGKDRHGLKNIKKTEISMEKSSLYRFLFSTLSVRNQRTDIGVSDPLGAFPLVVIAHDSSVGRDGAARFHELLGLPQSSNFSHLF
jgi:hypothetical protein